MGARDEENDCGNLKNGVKFILHLRRGSIAGLVNLRFLILGVKLGEQLWGGSNWGLVAGI